MSVLGTTSLTVRPRAHSEAARGSGHEPAGAAFVKVFTETGVPVGSSRRAYTIRVHFGRAQVSHPSARGQRLRRPPRPPSLLPRGLPEGEPSGAWASSSLSVWPSSVASTSKNSLSSLSSLFIW